MTSPDPPDNRFMRPADNGGADGQMAPFTACDLPLDAEGRIYHLQLYPEQIAPNILIVGDPGRAEMIGERFLHDLECEHEHRGLATITGYSDLSDNHTTVIGPLRTTATTSGIGVSSLEIVVSELVALNEIDIATRTLKERFPRLQVIRVGTSGGLQASTILGTPIITSYAIGLDNAGLFYETPYPDENCERLERQLSHVLADTMSTESRFYGKLQPYVTRAEPILVDALQAAAAALGIETKVGLTVSAPGFNAAQGRDVARMPPSAPNLDETFSRFDPGVDGQRVENMEMEASFLLHYLGGLGHWAGAICPAIANRRQDTFDDDYQDAIENAIKVALMALANTRKQYPDAWITP